MQYRYYTRIILQNPLQVDAYCIYSYYTITDAKLYHGHGLMYPATLLGGYASLSDQAVLQGLQVGSKNSNRFGCFRIGWFELRV